MKGFTEDSNQRFVTINRPQTARKYKKSNNEPP